MTDSLNLASANHIQPQTILMTCDLQGFGHPINHPEPIPFPTPQLHPCNPRGRGENGELHLSCSSKSHGTAPPARRETPNKGDTRGQVFFSFSAACTRLHPSLKVHQGSKTSCCGPFAARRPQSLRSWPPRKKERFEHLAYGCDIWRCLVGVQTTSCPSK